MLIKNQGGWSLFKTLIGLIIIVLVGIIILTSLGASLKFNITNPTLIRAECQARAKIEYIQSLATAESMR